MPVSLHGPSMTFHRECLYRGHEPSYYEEMHTFGARKKLSGKVVAYLVIIIITIIDSCVGVFGFGFFFVIVV